MMRIKTLCSSTLRGAVALAVVSGLLVQVSSAEPDPNRTRVRRGFSLFSSTTLALRGNRVDCGITNLGDVCVSTPGRSNGAFWPTGSSNDYIFGAGLHIAAIIEDITGFAWASDTVGAFFYDASAGPGGGQGDARSEIFNSLDPSDAANWPSGAVIRANSVYNDALVGSNIISQQDSWVLYWDSNPLLQAGRKHPLGVLVEQRSLAWNFPTGNEDIIYLIYNFYNVSASDASVYAGLDPLIRDDIAAAGVAFQQLNEDFFGVSIPDAGYAFTEMYTAFNEDADVGDFNINSSTPIIPFDMGVAYQNDFDRDVFDYPPEINSAPFGPFPGFTAAKYLQSPFDLGLTLFSNTNNPSASGGFPDPQNLPQMWRYISGKVTPLEGDNSCLFDPADKICFLIQQPTDTRFYMASGPFALLPGEFATIVVALVHAAPIAAIVLPFVGKKPGLLPGIPATGAQLAADLSLVRDIERATGWLSASDVNGNDKIDQEEVVTVPRSLLDKAIVAQSIFDGKFLLPFAPEQPNFTLVPGDSSVTIVWSPSVTETIGDPFFAVAGDPTSPLFDANYREFDLEGYRIYRGRTAAQLTLLAQFDFAGTVFIDRRGAWDYGFNCAPEIGIDAVATDVLPGCPVAFVDDGSGGSVEHPLVGDLAQILLPGRIELEDGSVIIFPASALNNSLVDAGFPGLADTGIPFAFIDEGVVNSNDYVYAVTAFDVNSINSAPGTLESGRQTKLVTPRAPAPSDLTPAVTVIEIRGRGTVLDPLAAAPTIDAATGTFSGPALPTSLLTASAALFADELVAFPQELSLRVDSITGEYYHNGTYFFTLTDGTGAELKFTAGCPVDPSLDEQANGASACPGATLPLGEEEFGPLGGGGDFLPFALPVLADAAAAAAAGQAGLPNVGQAIFKATAEWVTFNSRDAEWHTIVDNIFFNLAGISDVGGSRWFDGANETLADPTLGATFGALTGVTTIYHPQPFTGNVSQDLIRRSLQTIYHLDRAADVKIWWGATPGTVDSVIDVTHNVVVPFSETNRSSWGFRTDITTGGDVGAPGGPPDGVLDFYDFGHGACFRNRASWDNSGCLDPARDYTRVAVLSPADADGDNVADGDGFGLYLHGHLYIFQTATLPSNTVWTHRSYRGDVQQDASGTYTFTPLPGNPAVPGLELVFAVVSAGSRAFTSTEADLAAVHTVPDPYYVTSSLEVTGGRKIIKFVNLPNRAIIRIYSVSGSLVDIIEHNDPGGGGEAEWGVRNRNEQFVASGVYFYHIETESGAEKIGRMTVVNQAQ